MIERFVIDTTGIISFFHNIFKREQILSSSTYNIIHNTIVEEYSSYRISIPSTCFIEIHRIFFWEDEFIRQFQIDIYDRILNNNFIEIREIDKEVLEWVVKLGDVLSSHEINDKIMVSSAIVLNCPLITTDSTIIDFAELNPELLKVIS